MRYNYRKTRTIKTSKTKEDLEVTIKEVTNTPIQDRVKGMTVTNVIEEPRRLLKNLKVIVIDPLDKIIGQTEEKVTLQQDFDMLEKQLGIKTTKH